jgi:hypothetical protein
MHRSMASHLHQGPVPRCTITEVTISASANSAIMNAASRGGRKRAVKDQVSRGIQRGLGSLHGGPPNLGDF